MNTANLTEGAQDSRGSLKRARDQNHSVTRSHLRGSNLDGVAQVSSYPGPTPIAVHRADYLVDPRRVRSSVAFRPREDERVGVPLQHCKHAPDVFVAQGPEHDTQWPFAVGVPRGLNGGLNAVRVVSPVHDHGYIADAVHLEPPRQPCRQGTSALGFAQRTAQHRLRSSNRSE